MVQNNTYQATNDREHHASCTVYGFSLLPRRLSWNGWIEQTNECKKSQINKANQRDGELTEDGVYQSDYLVEVTVKYAIYDVKTSNARLLSLHCV